jgi:hypothetical protein
MKMADGENVVRRTPITEWNGQPGEIIDVAFVGCDGKAYTVVVRGDTMYVNGAKMCSRKDKPCEYIGKCMGNNEGCSYEGRNLAAPRGERCTFYDDHKDDEVAHANAALALLATLYKQK